MQISLLALGVLGVLTFAQRSRAQDPAPPKPEPAALDLDARTAALDALRTMDSAVFHFTGSVSIEKPSSTSQRHIFINVADGGSFSAGEPYEGEFIGYRYAGGDDIIMCSESRLPGFRVWFGKRKIVETLSEKKPLAVGILIEEASALLNFGVLERQGKKVDWTAARLKDGLIRLKAVLGPEAAPKPEGTRGFPMETKVLRVETELLLNADAWIQSAQFSIVHNDPMAARREQAGNRGALIIGANGEIGDPVEGSITHWTLEFAERPPDETVTQFRKEVSGFLDAKDF